MDFLAIIGIGVAAFAATDIDDLFVLMLFFSYPTYKAPQVITGQYLGIGVLVSVGIVGSLIALVVPATIVGLMGLLPITIGIKKLLDLRKHEDNEMPKNLQSNRSSYLRFLTVAGETIANGGDNIGIYVPLFASSSTLAEIITLVAIIFGGHSSLVCTCILPCQPSAYRYPPQARRSYRAAFCAYWAWCVYPSECLLACVSISRNATRPEISRIPTRT